MADALAGFTGIFNGPWGLCSDADGNLTIADTYNNAVRRVAAGSTSAGAVTTLAGSGLVNSRGSADGKGTAARFNEPNGLTVDPAGNVYVVDTYNCTIRMVTPAGVATTIAGTAVPTPPGIHADDTGAAAGFVFPTAIVRDRAGNLFVADVTDAAIRKITPDFVVTTFAGTAGTRGGADGTLNVGTLYNPRALAIDPDDDTIYVADSGNSTIRKITAAGAMTTVAGTAGSSGTADGVGTAAQFSTPSGIAVGPGKVLYVVDQGSNTIRKIATDGTVTTIAGSILNRGSRDGTGTDAWFSSPAGIAADTDGNLFVADTGSNLIRKIDTSYKVTTVAGVADKVGGADGTGSAVLFNSPVGIAVGPLNALYVCDTFNNTIRTGVHASGGGATGGVYAFSGATSLALRSDPASNGHGQSFAVVAPTITAQPASLTVSAGDSVNFVVGVTGSTPLAFQWSKNGIKLIGATASTYVLGSAQVSDAGAYSVVVSNAAGTVTSNSATLTVTGGSPAKSGAQLINLSSRTQVGTGANITISGFVVSGAERKSLLIRGIGPALANYGVSGAMATPTLTVFSGSTVLASNDGWKKTDADRIRATAQLLGAFALPEDGRDTGVGLIELYDANAAGGSKLINLSTRAFVGRDASILITGLVIAGPGPKTMLVRAVGPGLTAYGVDGVLSHPKMVLLSGQQAIASNTGWTTAANRADLVTVGAFPLDANSADSAMLLTLEPGIYTIQVSGASGETGTALVESYEVE